MLKNNIVMAFVGMAVLASPAFAEVENMELTVGQSKSITLPGNPTTGYMWSVAESPAVVKVEVDLANDTAPRGMVGCPRATVVTVTAVQAGQGTIQLVYSRPWEKGKAPADTHTINITVK